MMSIKNRFKKWLAKVLKNELLEYMPNNFSEIPPIRITEKDFQILRAEYKCGPYDALRKDFVINRMKDALFKEAEKYIEYKCSNGDPRGDCLLLELVVAIPKKVNN